MSCRILVGNLSTAVDEPQLKDFFAQAAGTVVSITIPMNERTGNCRGYAFVEMTNPLETKGAIDSLNGQSVDGRAVALSLDDSVVIKKRKWFGFGAG